MTKHPFLPVVTARPATKTLHGMRRPPQLEEVPFPLLTRARKNEMRAARGPAPTLELDYVRVLGVRVP